MIFGAVKAARLAPAAANNPKKRLNYAVLGEFGYPPLLNYIIFFIFSQNIMKM